MTRYAKPAAASVLLSALFLAVYPTCNWISSLRANVPSYPFEWERYIPFIPLMILPYMSLDLFFVAAPFLAQSDLELRTLAKRIAAAILIAGACFLLYPMRMSTARPPVDGPLGAIFNPFRAVDLPFNQCPCLHVALAAILLPVYLRRTRGLLRGSIALWFVAVAFSPLLTYQHHAIDILGGLVLAILCFHFFGDEPLRQPFTPNYRVASYYMVGALVLTAAAILGRSWMVALLWPAGSLAMMAAAYVVIGPGVFGKHAGQLPWTTRILLGPVLLGHRLSLLYYARRSTPYDRLTGHVWIGRKLSADESRRACEQGVTAVLDLAAEFTEPVPFRNADYLQLSILDLTAPTAGKLDEAVEFIRRHSISGIVHIHCKIGYSRTAAIAGAWLLASGRSATAGQAIIVLQKARRGMIVRPEARRALEQYQERGTSLVGAADATTAHPTVPQLVPLD